MRIRSIILCLVLSFGIHAQTLEELTDSLNGVLADPSYHDTAKAMTYVNLGSVLYVVNFDTLVYLSEQGIELAEKGLKNAKDPKVIYSFRRTIAIGLANSGYGYEERGEIDKAISNYRKCLDIQKDLKDFKGVAATYNNIGFSYEVRGMLDSAIFYIHKSLNMKRELKDSSGLPEVLNTIGRLIMGTDDMAEALPYYEESREVSLLRKYANGVSMASNSLGYYHLEIGDYDSSLFYYEEALDAAQQYGSVKRIAASYNGLSRLSWTKGQFTDAIMYGKSGLENAIAANSNPDILASHGNLGVAYLSIGNLNLALKHLRKSYEISKMSRDAKYILKGAKWLFEAEKKAGNYAEALRLKEEYITLRDSINKEANAKAIIRKQYQFKYEKQAAADSVKAAEAAKVQDAQLVAERAENKQHKLQAKQQEQQKYLLFGGLAIALLFGGFIFNRFRVTNKQKGIIEEQKKQVDEAYDQLEEKNTEILDSINYAKRIQSAILPPSKVVKEYLQKSFILYKPKDIVAGDFYWLEHADNKVLFAACDCTGHGVPGAMVSVVCNNGLNRSVREHSLTDPGKILDKTREIVINEFEKSEEEVKDGMDIALCSLEGNTLKYAGAHNPLWLVRKGATEIEEIKADKQPIGKYEQPIPYTTHTIELNSGDAIYIFSDGYADQFGGEKGKKFKAANFKKLLLSIQKESMDRQRVLLDEAFENWKGTLEQVDDICMIGLRI